MNAGKSISNLSFQSTTSTGVKSVQYLVKEKRYRVIWKQVYVAYVLDLEKAINVLKGYLLSIDETDKYREDSEQVVRHLNHINKTHNHSIKNQKGV
jgi:hypothetical protein